jgi:hypothetical protein
MSAIGRYVTDDLRAEAIRQRQAAGSASAGTLLDHAAEVIDSRDAALRGAVDRVAELETAIQAHHEYVTTKSGMLGGSMDRKLWSVLGEQESNG